MAITIKQFENDILKYINLAEREDIQISVDGKIRATLSSPNRDRIRIAKSLMGIIPEGDYKIEDAKHERLSQI